MKERAHRVCALAAIGFGLMAGACQEPTTARGWVGTFYGELRAGPLAEEPVEVHGTADIRLTGMSAPDDEYRFDVFVDRDALIEGSVPGDESIGSIVIASCAPIHEVSGTVGDDAMHGAVEATISEDSDESQLSLDGSVTLNGVSDDGLSTCEITGLFRATSSY